MLALTPRQQEILDLATTEGRVLVDTLATHFDVTPQTIRRDLNDLCAAGALSRVHGGAMLSAGVTNFGYDARRRLAADEKQRIGRAAADLIADQSTVLINIGTTTEQVARHLVSRRRLMVITNNINVVNILSPNPDFEVIVASGVVRHSDGGIVGEATVDFIRQFRVDYAIIGVSAIDEDGSLLDYDYREVRVAQAIIENARQVILVADSLKFERRAPVRIGHLADIDILVTDAPIRPELRDVCDAADVQVLIAR